MKKTRGRSIFTIIIALAFFAGLCYFVGSLVCNAAEWAEKPMNGHLSSTGLAQAGSIYDRNGTVLAESVDGERVYASTSSMRAAMLHTVGDDSTNISTAVQSTYRSGLTGYSFILGLGMPESFRTSSDITLTLDADACTAVYETMSYYGYKGACVVYNYETGEILCSVSTPSYDPYDDIEITDDDETYAGVYLDNVLSSSYPPGSTFKLITAAAALENIDDAADRYLYCEGSAVIGGTTVTCVEAHGEVNLTTAMAESCNIYFAELAVELGADVMTEYAEDFGFNKEYEVDDSTLATSQYDVSDADTAGLAWSGVGQYTDLANPLHMAMICSAIANGGTMTQPYMIESVSSGLSLSRLMYNSTKNTGGDKIMSSETADALAEMMRYTVSNHYGDSIFGGSLTVAAKTGTAEVGDDEEPDGWVVGYVLDEDYPLAFAVVIENGGYGISSAVPVASAALAACTAGMDS